MDAHKKVVAAQALLLEPTTSKEKIAHIRTLLYGINPQLDSALERAARELSTVDKILGGDVISLTAENLPEQTDEQKRRKKAIVFFVGNWNTLKSEVARVEKELAAAEQADTPEGKVSHVKKIFNFAKGPLGITTIVAVGIVLTMQTVAVEVTIKNQGCSPMTPSGSLPIPLPGLSLPKEPIENGGSAVATIPGLTFTIDGTQRSSLNAKALGFSMGFQLSGDMQDVQLDGASLLGKTTVARLSEKDEHELVFVCGR